MLLILTIAFVLQLYGFSWAVLVGIVMIFKVCLASCLNYFPYPSWLAYFALNLILFVSISIVRQVFTYSPKRSTHFHLMMRFIQGVTSLGLVAALALIIVFTSLSIADLFASILAYIPTGWAILCVSFQNTSSNQIS